MSATTSARRGVPHITPPTGLGIRAIHRRPCLRNGIQTGAKCICNPAWQAFYYDARIGKKVRKQFRTKAEALHWRQGHIQRIYKLDMQIAGRIDNGYKLLRKTITELDSAITKVNPTARASLREALGNLYRAEDAVVLALRDAVTRDQ